MKFNFHLFLILLALLAVPAFSSDPKNTPQSLAAESTSSTVKVIVSIVVILSFLLIALIFLCICYKTTLRLEAFAGRVRMELANEYQSALNLQLEQAVKVNTYLLKSLAPEKPLMGKSMLKSSWWKRTNSPGKKLKASHAPVETGEAKLIQLKTVENGNNGQSLISDPRNAV